MVTRNPSVHLSMIFGRIEDWRLTLHFSFFLGQCWTPNSSYTIKWYNSIRWSMFAMWDLRWVGLFWYFYKLFDSEAKSVTLILSPFLFIDMNVHLYIMVLTNYYSPLWPCTSSDVFSCLTHVPPFWEQQQTTIYVVLFSALVSPVLANWTRVTTIHFTIVRSQFNALTTN